MTLFDLLERLTQQPPETEWRGRPPPPRREEAEPVTPIRAQWPKVAVRVVVA